MSFDKFLTDWCAKFNKILMEIWISTNDNSNVKHCTFMQTHNLQLHAYSHKQNYTEYMHCKSSLFGWYARWPVYFCQCVFVR